MSLLPKIEAGLRGVQLLISLLFTIFWAWMHTQGFLQEWSTAPPGAYTYGAILFALGIIAGIWGLLAAAAHFALLSRARAAMIGVAVQGGRIAVDVLALGLFAGVRIMLSLTPSQFLPDILESSNPASLKAFVAIQGATGVGMVIALLLFAITLSLVIAQIVSARRRKGEDFGMLEENPATGGPYAQQSFSRPGYANSNASREPLAMYGAPPATSSSGFRPQEQMYNQPQAGYSTQSVGAVGYAQTTPSGYNTSTTSLPNGSAHPGQTQYTHQPRTPSVFSAAPLSAIGQAHGHTRGASSGGQHRRGPSAGQGYHQRQQSSYSSQPSQPPPSPWAGQTAYGGSSYQGQQPPTPGSKPLPAQPMNQRDTMQQAYAAHQQQLSNGGSNAYQPGRAPAGYVPQNQF